MSATRHGSSNEIEPSYALAISYVKLIKCLMLLSTIYCFENPKVQMMTFFKRFNFAHTRIFMISTETYRVCELWGRYGNRYSAVSCWNAKIISNSLPFVNNSPKYCSNLDKIHNHCNATKSILNKLSFSRKKVHAMPRYVQLLFDADRGHKINIVFLFLFFNWRKSCSIRPIGTAREAFSYFSFDKYYISLMIFRIAREFRMEELLN